jgi:acyl dehydratase
MTGKYFDELKAGDQFHSPRRTMTETAIVLFTSLAGLFNPLFVDDVFAREKGFGSRVAPGPLTMAFALGLTEELVDGTTSAALGINNCRFTAPVLPGDTISVRTTVVETRPSTSKPDQGVVTLRHEVSNEKGQGVCTFDRTLLMYKKAAG